MPIKNAKWTETRTVTDNNEENIELEVAFQYVDEGIGAYECHGYKGYQHDWRTEFVNARKPDGSYYDASDKEIEKWEEDAVPPEWDEDDYPPQHDDD
jgi:hypothetical protein